MQYMSISGPSVLLDSKPNLHLTRDFLILIQNLPRGLNLHACVKTTSRSVRHVSGFTGSWYPGSQTSYLKATWWKIYLIERLSLTFGLNQLFNLVKYVSQYNLTKGDSNLLSHHQVGSLFSKFFVICLDHQISLYCSCALMACLASLASSVPSQEI